MREVREVFGVVIGLSVLLALVSVFILTEFSFVYFAPPFLIGGVFILGVNYFTREPRGDDDSDVHVEPAEQMETQPAEQKESQPAAKTARELVGEIIAWVEFPFRILWNALVVITAVSLTVAWIIFLFGSVLGVILLLIFLPSGFFLPMSLLALTVELFPIDPWWES